jgi:hypothetical protein
VNDLRHTARINRNKELPSAGGSLWELNGKGARPPAPAGVSNEIVGGSFIAIDIDGMVIGTFDTLREPTRAFPERGGMR